MTATIEQLAALRRMVAEPTTATYADSVLSDLIEAWPLMDVNGEEPFTSIYQNGALTTRVPNTDWVPSYDLNEAAGALWAEKAGLLTANFDFSADGASYSRSQAYEQAMKQSRYYLARRSVRAIDQAPVIKSTALGIVNGSEG